MNHEDLSSQTVNQAVITGATALIGVILTVMLGFVWNTVNSTAAAVIELKVYASNSAQKVAELDVRVRELEKRMPYKN